MKFAVVSRSVDLRRHDMPSEVEVCDVEVVPVQTSKALVQEHVSHALISRFPTSVPSELGNLTVFPSQCFVTSTCVLDLEMTAYLEIRIGGRC